VIHADPPVEHKAYLHRSGRTARAGAQGTVITLMTDDQQAEVRDLTRRAGVRPTTSRTKPGDPLLARLAPGERTFAAPPPAVPAQPDAPGSGGARRGRGRGTGRGAGRPAEARHESGTVSRGQGRAAARSAETRPAEVRHDAGGASRGQGRGGGRPAEAGAAGRGRRGAAQPRTGSTPVHTSQSGGAAAFSSNSRVGRRSGR
jgi:superfamily II DNA/RNA helicase